MIETSFSCADTESAKITPDTMWQANFENRKHLLERAG